MPKQDHIVSQILQVMREEGSPTEEEVALLAEEYAIACEEVNRRLDQCRQYLDRNLVSEAVNLADTPPSVMDLAAVLDFQGADAWRHFCNESRLHAPASISRGVVAKLNEAYIRGQSVSELESAYRTASLRGSIAQRMAALRPLVEKDPSRTPELQRLEQRRLEEMKADVLQATGRQDVAWMERLVAELDPSRWTAEPDARIRRKLDQCIADVKRQRALKRGEKLADVLWEAYSALDYERAASTLAAWDALLAEGFFEPPSGLQRNVGEVRGWTGTQAALRKKERAFQAALTDLTAALDEEAPLAEVEKRLAAAERFEKPLPDTLKAQAARKRAVLEEQRRRKARAAVAGVIVLLLVLAGLAGLFARQVVRRRIRGEWLTRVAQAAEKSDYAQAVSLLDDAQAAEPWLARDATFNGVRHTTEQRLQEYNQRRVACAKRLDELEAIQRDGFPPARPAGEVEAAAAGLVETQQEKVRLQEWRLAKLQHDSKVQEEIDNAFSMHMGKAAKAIDAIESRGNPKTKEEHAAFKPYIDAATEALGAAALVQGVSPGLRAQLPLLEERTEQHRKEWTARGAQIDERDGLLARLGDPKIGLKEYGDLAAQFNERFAAHEAAGRFKAISELCALGLDLVRGADWPAWQTQETQRQALAFLRSPEGDKSIWKDSLVWVEGQMRAADALRDVLKELESLKQVRLLYDLYTHTEGTKGTPSYKRYYVSSAEANQKEWQRSGDEYLIQVCVYGKEDKEDARARVLHSTTSRLPLAPHCIWIRALLREVRMVKPGDYDEFLLARVEDLRTSADIDPVVRAVLMEIMLKNAKRIVIGCDKEIDGGLERLRTPYIDTNLYWMNYNPDFETVAAKRTIEAELEHLDVIPALLSRCRLLNRVHAATLARAPRYSHRVAAEGGQKVLKEATALTPAPAELWSVTEDRDGRRQVRVVAVRSKAGALAVLPGAELADGQPLFAPTDGRTTQAILDDICRDIPKGHRVNLLPDMQWPAVWPMNVREPAEGMP